MTDSKQALNLKESVRFLYEGNKYGSRHFFNLLSAIEKDELITGFTVSLGGVKKLPPVTLSIAGCYVASCESAAMQTFTFPSSFNDFGKELFNSAFKIHTPSHLPASVRDHVIRMSMMDFVDIIFEANDSSIDIPWIIVTVYCIQQEQQAQSDDKVQPSDSQSLASKLS